MGRATTAARGVSRSLKESGDVGRAQETVQALQAQLDELEAQFKAEVDAIEATTDPLAEVLQTIEVKPRKTDISVETVALVWAPGSRQRSV